MFARSTRIRAKRLNRLALQSWELGNTAKAHEYTEQAIGLMDRRNDGLADAVIRAEALLLRASIASMSADHGTASRSLHAAVALLEEHRVSKVRDFWLAEALTRSGDALRLAGRYTESRQDIDKVFGSSHWDDLEPLRKAAALNAKGILYKDTGRYQEAASLYAEAFELTTAVHGSNHPQVAALLHNMAGLAHVQGQYKEAEPHIRAALDIRHRKDRGDVAAIAADTSVLGAVLAGQGRLDEAEAALRTALLLWTGEHGPDHYEVAVQLNNLASVLQQRHEYTEAEASYTRALEIKGRVLGPDHPEVAALINNLASLEADTGRMASAALHYNQAIEILDSALGSQHPNTLACKASRRRIERLAADATGSANAVSPRPSGRN